jgi:alkaline phosphatase
MKRFKWYLLLVVLAFVLTTQGQDSPRVKYVFLFIGDGMGMAQVNLAQAYLSSMDEETGLKPLTFTGFPVTGLMNTYANNRLTTGSAAAGTAMATGYKTDIGRISMSPDKTVVYKTIAEKAKEEGMRVGIVTSVSIDHATPAVFYAHQPSRDMYFEIGLNLVTSNFDYFAGGGFKEPVKTVNGRKVDLMEEAEKNGFYILNDLQEFKELIRTRKKTIMFAPRTAEGASLPYAMDAGPGDVSLVDFTAKGIELLEGPEGFFMMVEGGKIDWACHANDAGATIQEVLAFDLAVNAALDFYRNYPDETLIVVTADHETGGLSLGNREMKYESNPSLFQFQKSSFEKLNKAIATLREKKTGKVDEDLKKLFELLDFNLGLNNVTNGTLLTEDEKQQLREMMEATIYAKEGEKSEYEDGEPLAGLALEILSKKAGVAWGSGSHTYIAVPVFALGAGAEAFGGLFDNTELPKKMERLMGID